MEPGVNPGLQPCVIYIDISSTVKLHVLILYNYSNAKCVYIHIYILMTNKVLPVCTYNYTYIYVVAKLIMQDIILLQI